MAQLTSFTVDEKTFGSPFNGCASGTSVTISTVTMRGATAVMGRAKLMKGSFIYSPLTYNNTLRLVNNVIPPVCTTVPTLPMRVPANSHIVGKVQYLKKSMGWSEIQVLGDPLPDTLPLTFGSISAPTSYSSVSIGGTTMRQATMILGNFFKMDIATTAATLASVSNYYKLQATQTADLNIFGAINHKLYLDY